MKNHLEILVLIFAAVILNGCGVNNKSLTDETRANAQGEKMMPNAFYDCYLNGFATPTEIRIVSLNDVNQPGVSVEQTASDFLDGVFYADANNKDIYVNPSKPIQDNQGKKKFMSLTVTAFGRFKFDAGRVQGDYVCSMK